MKNTRDLLLCLIVVLGLIAMPTAMAGIGGHASGMFDIQYGDDGDDKGDEDGGTGGSGY